MKNKVNVEWTVSIRYQEAGYLDPIGTYTSESAANAVVDYLKLNKELDVVVDKSVWEENL